MADLELTGVRLVAEGKEEYIRAIEQAREATKTLGEESERAGKGGIQELTVGSIAAGTAIGSILGSALQTGIQKIVEFAQGGIMAASTLQNMRMGIETLTATEILNTGTTDDMNEALQMAGPIAEGVMQKLRALSLQSPFEYQQILSVYQLNKSFGQTTEMSLKLTEAITNIGAAMPGIPNAIQRITYNFSQMAQLGRITARDIRDLAMAGVNLEQVFSQQLGKSVKQVNDDLQSGKMTFEQVSQAFVDYADKYFGTAAERMSKTFTGLISSFKDLMFFSSIDIFGPALQRFTTFFDTIFGKIRGFIEQGGLVPLGAALDVFMGYLLKLADVGMKAGEDFFQRFGGPIKQTAIDALEWGINISVQLATGIIQGAAAAITAAINFVGQLLSFFLAPGSPPKVAPDIDDWGAAAMTEYLKGFTQADFSILDTIGSSIKSALGALSGAGLMKSTEATELGQQISRTLAEGIASGDIGKALDRIRGSLGPYGEEVAILTEKQFELAKATDLVKEAEQKLADARKAEDKANQGAIDAANEYNKLAEEGASPEVLAQKRALFEAAKKAREQAYKDRVEAEKSLSTDANKISSLKEQVELQQKLVSSLIELTKQQAEPEKKLPKGGAAAAGAFKAAVPSMPKIDVEGKTQEMFEKARAAIQAKVQELIAPIKTAWNQDVKPAIQGIIDAWNTWAPVFGQAYDTWIKPIWPDLQAAGKWIIDNKEPIIAAIVGFGVGMLFLKSLAIPSMLAALASNLLLIGAALGPVILVGAAFALLGVVIQQFGPQALQTIQMLGVLIPYWFNNIKTTVMQLAVIWAFYINKLKTDFINFVTNLLAQVVTFKNNMINRFNEIKSGIIEKIQGALNAVKGLVGEFITIGGNIVQGIIDGVTGAGQRLFDTLVNLAKGALDAAKKFLGIESPSKVAAKSIGIPFGQGIAMGLMSSMGDVEAAVQKLNSAAIGSSSADATAARMRSAGASSSTSTTQVSYNLTLQSAMSPENVPTSFAMMQILAG